MIYLLDVNALLALALLEHEFHDRVKKWVRSLPLNKLELATCSVTELGLVRVLIQAQRYALSVTEARLMLLKLKSDDSFRWTFVSDGNDISHLPPWAKYPKQVTDGHLLELAKSNGVVLATFDRRIPGALTIP